MNLRAEKIKKLYYSIGEVSEITKLKQYVLRYWETEFPHLKPNKNSAGNRIYRQTDIDNLIEINSLLHKKKFTIKGAKQFLKDKKSEPRQPSNGAKVIALPEDEIKALKKIKSGIEDLLKLVDQYKE